MRQAVVAFCATLTARGISALGGVLLSLIVARIAGADGLGSFLGAVKIRKQSRRVTAAHVGESIDEPITAVVERLSAESATASMDPSSGAPQCWQCAETMHLPTLLCAAARRAMTRRLRRRLFDPVGSGEPDA